MEAIPTLEAGRKYQKVFDTLRQDILSGRFRTGEKLPSEADLVKQFGASRITIGRAVRDLQGQGLIQRRAGSGTYVREVKSSGLTFGLLIPNLGQADIFDFICKGMSDASRDGHHALLWSSVPENGSRAEQAWELCQQYIERRVSGVFFAPLEFTAEDGAVNRRIAAALEKARIPIVLLDRCYLQYPERSRHDLVGISNRRAGYQVTDHLVALGSRRIAFVAYPFSATTVEARISGYREALFLHGLPVECGLVRRMNVEDRDAVHQFLAAEKPDAFVCANDHTAANLMQTLLVLGHKLPQEFRIVGIDDVAYASLLPVPLTTVHQPGREIGLVAMTVMLDRLAHPGLPTRDILLAAKLIVRASSGVARS